MVLSCRVVDCGGLKLKENQTLLLLVSTIHNSSEVGKLSIDAEEKRSKEWLEMPCAEGMLSLKLTLWQDLLKGINSVFHGQVRVDVDENWKSGPAKWFYLRSKANEDGEGGEDGGDIGDATVKVTYQIDHILRMQVYKPLLDLLFLAGDVQPLTASLVAVIEALPKVELGPVSRSLVELMAQSDRIRPVLSSLYVNSILKCQDENTLFRGQSLSGKMLFEILTTYGKMYLITTLKPVVDKIYKERKNCEVDPARVAVGASLEKNRNNLLVYFQMLFERVTTSSTNCPHLIKQLLYDLRNVVGTHSSRSGVQRLAVSSFVIMRFFAAAILNPKAFEIRKDQPDLRVSRTLLLLSKLLQRLSNCSVSEGPLSSKEIWLNGVFETVTSEQHKSVMASFLDNISLVGDRSEPQKCTVFKFGNLQQVDRSRLAWKKVLHYKKRYVQLTNTHLIWQKDVQCAPKGTVPLSDIKFVNVDNKNIITIVCETMQLQFEAPGGVEATDWLNAIERQRNRAAHEIAETPGEHFFVDAERHVDKIHTLLYKYRETMIEWRDQLQSNVELDEKTAPELLKASYVVEEERQSHKDSLIATLCSTIDVTDAIQLAHTEYEKENKVSRRIDAIITAKKRQKSFSVK
ncbi:Ras GTPase-activating protein gap-1 [Caenorhabditis elegans]|uniref:Ras GTPase-activating protein gap-1 n=1 Tax=Caenorhabditis elegans TaxID=6239 RepID=GAP1_CAEEL|nr:Ras GTPase-activating protein gap-1 [Caenorhabditis elegans]Q22720.1 RecName: Full=Ras GTPase-activating protein gap-1; Short=GTPase-activating protein 1 [Caenorhabditis elegans]AAD13781.1 GTPase activating protein GAP-1 [Caenorhabditis elegans]CCD71505.1 Ras GTPase-activating protein gap-1 [Caenorhabditis elegans]|eukprot:NP_508404.1 Ras GTPase-activating protein gap-1 [Caenorhabditis elegans]